MAKLPLQRRRQRYHQLSSRIAQIDDVQLAALFTANKPQWGWGKNHTLDLDGTKVFVKRVPITEIQHAHPYSTRNLYGLPMYYNYGVGSAGFNVFRELVTHIRTTNWVLSGQIEHFPLMYHHRIIPITDQPWTMDAERHRQYVEYWGGSDAVGRYVQDRGAARHELVLFLEHIPHVLRQWLKEHPGRTPVVVDHLRTTIDFLRQQGIIHLDAHFDNVLTDGSRTYLTDFGLTLDRSFDLAADEVAFFNGNTHYDYGEALSGLTCVIGGAYDALSVEAKQSLKLRFAVAEGEVDTGTLLEHIEELSADGSLHLDRRDVQSLVRYRPVITMMRRFYTDLRRNSKKDTPFPHRELRRGLKATGFL